MDTDNFVLSNKTENIIKDLKILEAMFDFSNLDNLKNMKYSVKRNKKKFSNFKSETPKKIRIDEFLCLKSKMYSFKGGDDIRNKLKGISKSQSKHIKFEIYNICLNGEEYKKYCDKYIIQSIFHEMYLQKVKQIYTIFI